MAKPSHNKVKGPKQSTIDLNSTTDLALVDATYALNGEADFATLWGLINFEGATYNAGTLSNVIPSGSALFDNYDYVFLSSSAGKAGTLTGATDLAGVIAAGVGKDTVIGGDLNDVIFLANGSDVGDGGDGDDIMFGENGKDVMNGGLGNDVLDGGHGKDELNGDEGNDWLSGGSAKDTLEGGTDDGTALVTAFTAVDASGDPVAVLTTNEVVIADGAVLNTAVGGTPDVLVEEGVFVDTSVSPNDIYHIFSFTPTDVGAVGGQSSFTVALYDTDGSLVDSFDVMMTEGSKNLFSFQDNDTVDDGGTVAVFAGIVAAPATLTEAALTAVDTEAYEPVTLTPTSVDLTAGDVLIGGSSGDVFVYNKVGTTYDGVDIIGDYGSGDSIVLNGITETEVTSFVQDGNLVLMFSDGAGGIVADAAIQVIGITDINDVNLVFA